MFHFAAEFFISSIILKFDFHPKKTRGGRKREKNSMRMAENDFRITSECVLAGTGEFHLRMLVDLSKWLQRLTAQEEIL